MRRLTEYDEQRFWANVSLPDADGHMWWLGAKNSQGYGTFYAWSMSWQASRMALFLAEGPPPGDHIWKYRSAYALHLPVICHSPACVAPLHLRWGSADDNQADARLDRLYDSGVPLDEIRGLSDNDSLSLGLRWRNPPCLG